MVLYRGFKPVCACFFTSFFVCKFERLVKLIKNLIEICLKTLIHIVIIYFKLSYTFLQHVGIKI